MVFVCEVTNMIGGYARLSRDEDGQDYSSIENQIFILEEAAKINGHHIDKWYIDDGISGYVFNRPAFNELRVDLEHDLDILYVKDFSRIGRHNARVLLFIEEFEYTSKRLIAVNENYDSIRPEDDETVGIKTWMNERYVKDTSKKIRKVLEFKQRNNTLPYRKHWGYDLIDEFTIKVNNEDKKILDYIARLYVEGSGYRKIAHRLEDEGYKTPSEILHERDVIAGVKKPYRITATTWSAGMVKEILCDDFFAGIRRTHKRHKNLIHGPDLRVPMDEQYIFEDDHEPIWDMDTWNLIQAIKAKRNKFSYRGSTEAWKQDIKKTLFPGILYCSECGHSMSPIVRKRKNGTFRKYYICSQYNTKGTRYCAKSHLIEENTLLESIYTTINVAMEFVSNALENVNLSELETGRITLEKTTADILKRLDCEKKKLEILINQKISDMMITQTTNRSMVSQAYDNLQKQVLDNIQNLEDELSKLDETDISQDSFTATMKNAKQFLEYLLSKRLLEPVDFVTLFERIEINENGLPYITFRNGLSEAISYDFETALNMKENELISQILQWFIEDGRGYTSFKFLKKRLDANGTHRTRKAIETYLAIFERMGIIQYNLDDKLRPYLINKEKLLQVSECYMDISHSDGMPQMVFEYVLKRNGMDPTKDLSINQSIDFGSTAAAFSGGQGDYTVEFEPSATALELAGEGYVVASLGVDSGYVPYTSYCVTKEYLEENEEIVQKFTNALQKGMEYVNTHTPEEIAKVIAPQFKETDIKTIEIIVKRYHEQDSWKEDLIFEEESFDLLQNILEDAGELDTRTPYNKLVDTSIAKKAAKK